ncbi:hypothetical protein CH373_09680 [Leptospira perolatii]|uniref:Calcineurin-like phosphoesterase domain-containing protein n=1 Tax=Leptospira perolatii TaxID=2023191 RepID=A0A2M9ZME5_9LEPT|nr:metallophosphoesterase [Leptospira perolatii]PJZ70058.1 hypothetical protein CH360_07425 [Leptospira perolatii]PJZ73246.1 hypothetical protein CH373_09680 [Leptospira perolatii]
MSELDLKKPPKADLSLAVVGDIHGFWNQSDVEYFSTSSYDGIFFVGDLGNRNPKNQFEIAKSISQIRKPKYLIPGNHDTTSIFQLLGEISGWNPIWTKGSVFGQKYRFKKLVSNLGDVRLCGYSVHSDFENYGIQILGARPFSMGARLNFQPYLKSVYRINTLEESTEKLVSLSKEIGSTSEILVLAHNGPFGLGERPVDIWGCDFKKEGGDWGDRDLQDFLKHCNNSLTRVPVVIAGHMHHHARHLRNSRTWCVKKEGTLFVNAARVPRIFKDKDGMLWHHHVRLSRVKGTWKAEAVFLKNGVIEIHDSDLPKFLRTEKENKKEI